MFKKRGQKRRGDDFGKKFISEAAEARYETNIVVRNLVSERGFVNPGGRVEMVIASRCWEYLAAPPSHATIPVVREFYANAKEHNNFNAFVRGKWVPFDSESINNLYRLPNIENDEYSTFLRGEIDFDKILRCLTRYDSGATWKRREGKIVNLPSAGLNAESKAWHYFISGKLMPTGNTSEVTKERAILNYCIQNEMTIDVGKVIHQSLLYLISGVSTSGLGHPSLINDLCEAVGVPTHPSEEMHHPKSALTKQKIHSYAAHSMSERGESSSQPRGSPPPRSKAPTISDQMASLSKKVDNISATLERHDKWQHHLDSKMGHYFEQQSQHYEYMANFNHALENMFENCSLNIGPRRVDFPEPPSYRPYQYQEPEAAEEEEEEE